MKRWLFLVYGVLCHLLFLGVFAYLAVFVGDLFVPKTIDTAAEGPVAAAVAINLLLLGLWAAQHSIMARPAFKKLWTRIVPPPIERSTYVLISGVLTILLMWQWRGMDALVWNVREPVWRAALWGLFVLGWLLVPAATLMIDHFDLFGTRQVWLYLKGREDSPSPFRVRALYKHMRHPIYVGWAIAFWATPTMTAGHLLFAGVLTGYMALATLFEERDLIAHFGQQYEQYRRRVPRFIPRLRLSPQSSKKAALVSNPATPCTHGG